MDSQLPTVTEPLEPLHARLEDLTPGARVRGVLPDRAITVVQVEWHGTQVLTLTYRDDAGKVDHELLDRGNEARLEIEGGGRAWSFDADGGLFRLASEALRIRLAHLFDPYLAVHTSNLDPLPHQIRAVYGEMLPRQPLRFLLADDPGAGKTIMAGHPGIPRTRKSVALGYPPKSTCTKVVNPSWVRGLTANEPRSILARKLRQSRRYAGYSDRSTGQR